MPLVTLEIRRRAAVFGVVTDALTGRAIPGAVVEIALLTLHVLTRADGSYWFGDLPAGNYDLRVSVPGFDGRYGVANVTGVEVADEASGKPIFDARANVALVPTQVVGRVTDNATSAPIAGAIVRIRGSDARTVTAASGDYRLAPLAEGNPTLEVSARGYVVATRKLQLTPGQQLTADVALSKS